MTEAQKKLHEVESTMRAEQDRDAKRRRQKAEREQQRAEAIRQALKADIDREAWESLYRTRSRPFPKPSTGTIAVKVINHHGDEVLKTYPVA